MPAANPDGNTMSFMDKAIPALSEACMPPLIRGVADLTSFAYQGNGYDALMDRIRRPAVSNAPESEEAAWTYDAAIAAQLSFRRAEGLNLQDAALATSQVYRVAAGEAPLGSNPPLRVLALMGPGDLMTNTPLDFLTNYLNIRLDLLYILPDRPLPSVIPDHDIAFFAVGEADAAALARLRWLYAVWPRPTLNDPRFLPALERDALSRSLAGVPGVCSPTAVAVSRAVLDQHLDSGRAIEGFDAAGGLYPCLIRPIGSHAGSGLSRLLNPAELADYLRFSFERQFYITAFEDYAGTDGFYRKSRVAFIDRQPFLCHMAISQHWMVHYLNAGMTESAEKRAGEAHAMAGFDLGFARRHEAAFEALHDRLGFDYYSIDCGETRDGRLLVFEADAAAIIHLMDPPDLFPYKQPQMHKVFAAFDAMLRRRVGAPVPCAEPIRRDGDAVVVMLRSRP
jgi:hypothetical protein